ncbi:MAG: glycerol acyltransferase [Porphyromonadaceae bacterium]|nr:glycerol acyltransferase [Porphyromonadaceae bacterium]
MENDEIMRLDVDEILKAKLPNKKLPRFVVNYLKKIVHQDEMNAFFQEAHGLKNIDFIEKTIYDHLQSGADFEGLENLPPKDGRYIFVSNHPLGGLDSLILGLVLGRHYDGKVKFFANDILMFLKPMQDMFLPVNKGGKGGNVRENARAVDEFFRSDNHLIMFPAGANSRKINGKIQDLPWVKTFVTKALQYQRDVVPITFEARNSNFFYNLSKIRTKLGLPNLEMLYLVDEMYKQRGNRFNVKIGKTIPYTTFDKSKTHYEWANWVREKVVP